MKFIVKLVRHGETTANLDGTFAGSLNVPMTALGRQQCEITAKHLAGWTIDHAYASPLSRSIETAKIILAGREPTRLSIDQRLSERDFGNLAGKDKSVLPLTGLSEAEESKWGLETHQACTKRVLSFWNELFPADGQPPLVDADGPAETFHILISTHGALVRDFLEGLSARGYSFSRGIKYDYNNRYGNCSIFTIEMEFAAVEGWKGTIVELGSEGHLKDKATNAAGDVVPEKTVNGTRV